MMAAVLIAMLVIAGAAATGALGQTYPGPSQRIEPMQSMQPMQPIAPMPTPPMRAPGDNPGNATRSPEATDSTQGSPTAGTGSDTREVQPKPACTIARHQSGDC